MSHFFTTPNGMIHSCFNPVVFSKNIKIIWECNISDFLPIIGCFRGFFEETIATYQKKNYFCSAFVRTGNYFRLKSITTKYGIGSVAQLDRATPF